MRKNSVVLRSIGWSAGTSTVGGDHNATVMCITPYIVSEDKRKGRV